MNIVGIAAEKAKADFSTTVAAYAETSIALFDAFICCWDEKYRSNYIRPETAINRYVDQEWRPLYSNSAFSFLYQWSCNDFCCRSGSNDKLVW